MQRQGEVCRSWVGAGFPGRGAATRRKPSAGHQQPGGDKVGAWWWPRSVQGLWGAAGGAEGLRVVPQPLSLRGEVGDICHHVPVEPVSLYLTWIAGGGGGETLHRGGAEQMLVQRDRGKMPRLSCLGCRSLPTASTGTPSPCGHQQVSCESPWTLWAGILPPPAPCGPRSATRSRGWRLRPPGCLRPEALQEQLLLPVRAGQQLPTQPLLLPHGSGDAASSLPAWPPPQASDRALVSGLESRKGMFSFFFPCCIFFFPLHNPRFSPSSASAALQFCGSRLGRPAFELSKKTSHYRGEAASL